MKRISTHILDLARGKPASAVPVRLEEQDSTGDWRLLTSTHTDQEGRCLQLLPESEDLGGGVYRLIFDTGSYFAQQKIAALYPVVMVAFQVQEGESHFHLPLLLSPNGYTTYRGS
ncbi:MAG: hydroxyisourate hydrolase [Candidatus Sulfotelmatobacter sp.]|jgi:5-hydroxyisourate hydrolase